MYIPQKTLDPEDKVLRTPGPWGAQGLGVPRTRSWSRAGARSGRSGLIRANPQGDFFGVSKGGGGPFFGTASSHGSCPFERGVAPAGVIPVEPAGVVDELKVSVSKVFFIP